MITASVFRGLTDDPSWLPLNVCGTAEYGEMSAPYNSTTRKPFVKYPNTRHLLHTRGLVTEHIGVFGQVQVQGRGHLRGPGSSVFEHVNTRRSVFPTNRNYANVSGLTKKISKSLHHRG